MSLVDPLSLLLGVFDVFTNRVRLFFGLRFFKFSGIDLLDTNWTLFLRFATILDIRKVGITLALPGGLSSAKMNAFINKLTFKVLLTDTHKPEPSFPLLRVFEQIFDVLLIPNLLAFFKHLIDELNLSIFNVVYKTFDYISAKFILFA